MISILLILQQTMLAHLRSLTMVSVNRNEMILIMARWQKQSKLIVSMPLQSTMHLAALLMTVRNTWLLKVFN